MALTDDQKAKARYYLGVPDVSVEPDYEVESALNLLSASAETIFTGLLTRLDAIETSWGSSRAYAGLKRAEDIEFYQGQASRDLDRERETLLNRMATMLGIVYPRPYAQNAGRMNGQALRG